MLGHDCLTNSNNEVKSRFESSEEECNAQLRYTLMHEIHAHCNSALEIVSDADISGGEYYRREQFTRPQFNCLITQASPGFIFIQI